MKKLLLSLVALLGVMNASAQVTETDLSAYNDVFYVKSMSVLQGTESIDIAINAKAHQNFTAFELYLVLPDGATVKDLNGIEQTRRSYVVTKGSDIYEYNTMSDGSYKIVGTASCDRGLSAGDGTLSYVTIDVSSLAVGTYPIIIKNATFSGFQNPETGESTGEADIVIAGEITTALTISDRLAFNETDDKLPTYTAGDTKNVSMTRTINANEWSTICLPFTLNQTNAKAAFGDDVKLATFDSFEVGYTDESDITPDYITINFKTYTLGARTSMAGGTPYLIKTSKTITSFESDGVKLVATPTEVSKSTEYSTNAKFIGTFVKTVVPQDGLFISNEQFWYSTGATQIKAFRAWFMLDEVLDKATDFGVKFNVFVDGEETKIEDISDKQSNNAVYTLDGKYVGNDMNRLHKGVYIQNGKKVVK